MKVKVQRNEGLKLEGKFKKVFLNLDGQAGTEIELTEKELKYVLETNKRVIKAQKILSDYLVRLEGN